MVHEEATRRFLEAPWLADVGRDVKLAILGVLTEECAKAGTVLLAQGQPNDHLTFLIDGSVELDRVFRTGRKEVITALTAPAVFGTTSFFQPRPPTISVTATMDAWMLTLYHPAHLRLREENPRAAEALALGVVRTLSERFDLIDQLFTDYIMHHDGATGAPPSEWARFRANLFGEK